jgi:polyhydroxybutyrate depolymerase
MNCTVLLLLSAAVAQLATGDHARSIDVAGVTRKYDVHIPAGYDATKPHPLMLIFHGFEENPATMALDSGLNDKSDLAGFIAVYPAGSDYPAGSGNRVSWNAGLCCHPSANDVEFVKELLEDIATVANIDAKRIYAVGMSNGAMMANRLACEIPSKIAAIGTVAGTKMIDPCSPNRSIPVIHFHGTQDKVISFDGTEGKPQVPTTSVAKHIAFWVKNNKADATAQMTTLSSLPMKVTQERHRSTGVGSAEVVLIVIEGGGHLWPGRPRPARFSTPEHRLLLGETTQTVSANDLMWEFLKKHELR